MKKTILTFSVCFILLGTSLSFGQDLVVLKGVVRDSITKQVLSDVRISVNPDPDKVLIIDYENRRIIVNPDTAFVRNNTTGEFQISVEKGSKIWFRKQGYLWKNIVVTGNDAVVIELPPSPSGLANLSLNAHNYRSDRNNPDIVIEYYFNGVLIPEEEWNDVRITRDDIHNIGSSDPANPANENFRRFTIITK